MDELETVKEEALRDLRSAFERARMRAYQKRTVPQYEMASWPFQAVEAKAYLEGRTDVPTPYLDAFFALCPRDRTVHCEAVVRNSEKFARIMGMVNGVQTRFWDQILEADSAESVREILEKATAVAGEIDLEA